MSQNTAEGYKLTVILILFVYVLFALFHLLRFKVGFLKWWVIYSLYLPLVSLKEKVLPLQDKNINKKN